MDAEGASLSEVLQAVARRTGVEISGSEGLSSRTFMHFAGMDLLPALQELLSGLNYGIAGGSTESASSQKTRVVVVRPAGSGQENQPEKVETNTATASTEAGQDEVIQNVAPSDEDPSPPEESLPVNLPPQADEQNAAPPVPGVSPQPRHTVEHDVAPMPEADEQNAAPAVPDVSQDPGPTVEPEVAPPQADEQDAAPAVPDVSQEPGPPVEPDVAPPPEA